MSQQYPHTPQDPNQQPQQSPWGARPQAQPYSPAQAPYQAVPPYQPEPPKKKSWIARHKSLAVIGTLVALLVVGGIASGGGEDTASDTANTAPGKETDAKPAGAGDKEAPADKPADKPKPESKSYGDGDYVVGEDIPAGKYTSTGAKKGLFEMCVISTEGDGTIEHMGQLKSANADERIIITLAKADGVLTVAGCEDLKPRK